MYDDFDNSTPYAVDMMAEFLVQSGSETRPSSVSSSSNVSMSTPASSTSHSMVLPPFSTMQNTPELNAPSSQSNAGSRNSNLSSAPWTGKYFELCINHSTLEKRLGEIDVSRVSNDGELFCKIRDRYQSLRGSWAGALSLRKPVDIHYVRVGFPNFLETKPCCSCYLVHSRRWSPGVGF